MDYSVEGIGDELGPIKILIVHEPGCGLEGIVVVDNVACGPAIGGTRMAPDVTVEEVFRLARAMTLKNAAAGLPHGGAKSGIVADPDCPPDRKEKLVRTFARAIRDLVEYVPGPDMGTNEACMAWVGDEIGRCVGLPRVVGGIPLDEIGATGFGLAIVAEVAAPRIGLSLQGARVAVRGFGAVGAHAARFLARRGARLVAASDSHGAIVNPDGLVVDALMEHKRTRRPVHEFGRSETIDPAALVGVDCDIWIPAARPDVLNEGNVPQLKAKLVLQGANIPATAGAETWMHENGVLSVPDFIANAGGVICASVEYHGGSQGQAMTVIEEKIRKNVEETLARAERDGVAPRAAATALARARVEEAMRYHRP